MAHDMPPGFRPPGRTTDERNIDVWAAMSFYCARAPRSCSSARIVGLACAAAVSRSMGGALYGVRPIDLPTFVGGSLLLIAVAVVATYVPARHAATVDPLIALKDE